MDPTSVHATGAVSAWAENSTLEMGFTDKATSAFSATFQILAPTQVSLQSSYSMYTFPYAPGNFGLYSDSFSLAATLSGPSGTIYTVPCTENSFVTTSGGWTSLNGTKSDSTSLLLGPGLWTLSVALSESDGSGGGDEDRCRGNASCDILLTVPEPASLALVALALPVLFSRRKRRSERSI